MIKIATVEEMRKIEAAADTQGVSYRQMMERAGFAVAERVQQLIREIPNPRVAFLIGPGNNGGDGLVAGRIIAQETNATVTFFLVKIRNASDENFSKVRDAKLLVADTPTDSEQGFRVLKTMIANADVIVDALLGTGSKLPIKGDLGKVLTQVHSALSSREQGRAKGVFISPSDPEIDSSRRPIIIAVDIPTGLDADTAAVDPNILRADETITFEVAKYGHLLGTSADVVGKLSVASLGLPDKLKPRDELNTMLVDAATVRALLPNRPANANKGTFGKALIVAGSLNYIGAPVLAASAAYRVGTGLVTVAASQAIVPILAAHILETTWLMLPNDLGAISDQAASVLGPEIASFTAALIGPGLGQETTTKAFIEALLLRQAARKPRRMGFGLDTSALKQATDNAPLPPLVIDADGLNLLAKIDEWWNRLPARTILTPHPGEMARLAGIADNETQRAVEIVQTDRIGIARKSANKWNCVVVLKGANTVIADPDGRVAVLPFANAALATAGTGDVLGGAITGYLAQGLDPFDAAVVGGFIQGYAGELATAFIGNKASVLASDLVATLADAITGVEQSA